MDEDVLHIENETRLIKLLFILTVPNIYSRLEVQHVN